MTMPARDPKAQEKMDRNKELADVMEQAVQFYKLQYNTANAQAARDYINNRASCSRSATLRGAVSPLVDGQWTQMRARNT